MTEDDLIAALTDTQVLALTLYGETRGEPIEGKVAVGCVIRNRLPLRRYGLGYRGVSLRPWQFSCWNDDGSANHRVVIATAQEMHDGKPPDRTLRECSWVADGIIADMLCDRINGATHYMTNKLYQAGTVAWAKGLVPVAHVGGHVFFSGVL